MEPIKTLLVDDEVDSREVIASLIEKYFPDIDLVGEASNIDQAYELVLKKKPALVFLDIQMPKATGFDLLKKFGQPPFEVVFITSYDKYAINAIKFSALDYLLKPVEIEELAAAINKVKQTLEAKLSSGTQIINLVHSLSNDTLDRKMAVHSGDKVKFISAVNIVHVESESRYSHITTLTREVNTVAKSLKEFEEYFDRTGHFVRITKSCIINVRHIRNYSKGDPCIIEMVNGKTFEVARRKKTEVLTMLKKSTC